MTRAALILLLLSLLPIHAAVAQQDATTPPSQTTPQATPAPAPMPPLQQRPDASAPPIPGATMLETPDGSGGVFGAGLFKGRFAQQSFSGFNPGYAIAVGDRIDLKLWGAVELNVILTVDSQGNIFVPRVGPVAVANIRNSELNVLVGDKVRSIYRENVGVYAALANAEPVKVFVTGYVQSPGLYGAFASDSLLHFLDLAGGVSPARGSFLDVRVLRAGTTVGRFNLYDFLLNGTLPLFQFQDGDTIVVWPQKSVAKVDGLVRNAAQFEFDGSIALPDLLTMAGADPRATHVLLVRNQAPAREVQYLSVKKDVLADVKVMSGDAVSVFADRQVASIVARIEGEYEGLGQVALPYNSTLADLIGTVKTSERSNVDGVQLYRSSIAERQKQVIDDMLNKLEQSVLNARSGTREEAELRVREADLVMQFVARARQIEPTGRLVLHSGFDPRTVDLQDGDLLRIPRKTNTVAVQGEVYFPSSFVYQDGKSVKDYLQQAGGMTQKADATKVFVMRPSGELVEANLGWFSSGQLEPGDEIMVLPRVDDKSFQLTKDLVQVLYQIAVAAGVVLRL